MDQLSRLNKKVISVSSPDDIEEEKRFWLSKGAQERIEAIERILFHSKTLRRTNEHVVDTKT